MRDLIIVAPLVPTSVGAFPTTISSSVIGRPLLVLRSASTSLQTTQPVAAGVVVTATVWAAAPATASHPTIRTPTSGSRTGAVGAVGCRMLLLRRSSPLSSSVAQLVAACTFKQGHHLVNNSLVNLTGRMDWVRTPDRFQCFSRVVEVTASSEEFHWVQYHHVLELAFEHNVAQCASGPF